MNIIDNIAAWYDETKTQPVPTEIIPLVDYETGQPILDPNTGEQLTITVWTIDKNQLYETVPENPNVTSVFYENLEEFPIYDTYTTIITDDTHSVFGYRCGYLSREGVTGYEIYSGHHMPGTLDRIDYGLNIPRSKQTYSNMKLRTVRHNMTHPIDRPKYIPPKEV